MYFTLVKVLVVAVFEFSIYRGFEISPRIIKEIKNAPTTRGKCEKHSPATHASLALLVFLIIITSFL